MSRWDKQIIKKFSFLKFCQHCSNTYLLAHTESEKNEMDPIKETQTPNLDFTFMSPRDAYNLFYKNYPPLTCHLSSDYHSMQLHM